MGCGATSVENTVGLGRGVSLGEVVLSSVGVPKGDAVTLGVGVSVLLVTVALGVGEDGVTVGVALGGMDGVAEGSGVAVGGTVAGDVAVVLGMAGRGVTVGNKLGVAVAGSMGTTVVGKAGDASAGLGFR